MTERLDLRMMPKNRHIHVTNCSSERCFGSLENVPVQMGELVVCLDFLILDESACDVIVGLPIMIQLRDRSDYYRIMIKIHFTGDSEILNYEYEYENKSEDEFIYVGSEDTIDQVSEDELKVMIGHEDSNYGAKDEDDYWTNRYRISTRTGQNK